MEGKARQQKWITRHRLSTGGRIPEKKPMQGRGSRRWKNLQSNSIPRKGEKQGKGHRRLLEGWTGRSGRKKEHPDFRKKPQESEKLSQTLSRYGKEGATTLREPPPKKNQGL